MSNYKIGLYNPKVETDELLKQCNIIFNNFDDLKNHVRAEDEVILASEFSIFNFNETDLISLIENYQIDMHLVSGISLGKENLRNIVLNIKMFIGTNNYIKFNLDKIKKL